MEKSQISVINTKIGNRLWNKHLGCSAAVSCLYMLGLRGLRWRVSSQARWIQQHWSFGFFSVLWGTAHFQGLLVCIPLCSSILAEGSLLLTTSLISLVSWFLVFPTISCNFSHGIERCVVFINETTSSDHHDSCRITYLWRRKEATGAWSK